MCLECVILVIHSPVCHDTEYMCFHFLCSLAMSWLSNLVNKTSQLANSHFVYYHCSVKAIEFSTPPIKET